VIGMASNLNGGAGLGPGAAPRLEVPSRSPLLIGFAIAAVFLVVVSLAWTRLRGNSVTASSSGEARSTSPALAIDSEPDPPDTAEVILGEFDSSNGTASPGSMVHVSFKIAAVTPASLASVLEQKLKTHQARIRQIVNTIVRSSSLDDLNDPNLATIKRLIREEVNRLLRKSCVNEIVITDVRVFDD